MIDGLWKHRQDRFWDAVAAPLARAGISPNALTLGGLAIAFINCAAFLWHRNPVVFGVVITASEMLDNLDGAVARVAGRRTAFGGYLDAVTDRYKDAGYLLAIALVTGYWLVCFLAVTGSLATSYHKARAALEAPVQNDGWPDLFERFERTAFLCAALILTPFVPTPLPGVDLLFVALVLLAAITHLTAVQRLLRARELLR